ncbi:MAG TPA: thiamine pyrophosphate-dependent enzyme, partial [Mycobacterium sp.]|nr:thiamine pyrophosphate-dependent enzyme [Mycobacterium sp.]
IEAITYRMGPHTTSDDPSRYRSAEEVEEWAARDPISRYRTYLERAGVWTERVEQRAAARSARLRAEARSAVIDGPDPDPGELFDHVYAEITPALAAQKRQLLTELAKEA